MNFTHQTRNIAIKHIKKSNHVRELFYSGKVPFFFIQATGNKEIYFSNFSNLISIKYEDKYIYPLKSDANKLHYIAKNILHNSLTSENIHNDKVMFQKWQEGSKNNLIYMRYTEY